jgi:mono/diheme cytochrome c family protein
MTATRFWKYMHDRIPASVFKSKAVGGPSNCAACHQDAASGLFSPFAIELPEE